jgi:WhiB family redox-sensing transcriptional regulator
MTDAYVPLTGPPAWQHAACRGEDPELWFPIGPMLTNPNGETAVDICHRCEHAAECVAWAAHVDARDGIWGGTTPEQRNPILAQKQRHAELERERRKKGRDERRNEWKRRKRRLARLDKADVQVWRQQQLAHAVSQKRRP